MNFLKMIRLAIAFVVGFILMMLFRLLILPRLKVFFPSLPPSEFWGPITSIIIEGGKQAVPYILAAFFFFYIVYKVINKVVCRIPIVGKIVCKIVNKTPPFPEFKKSGIFGLFDGISGIIFSRKSLKDRVKDLGLAIAGFIEGSFTYTAQTVDDTFHITQKVNKLRSDINKSVSSSIDSASSSVESALTLKPPNLTNGKGDEFNKPPVDEYENEPSPILTDEQREVDDKYQQCVIENVQIIPPGMIKDDIRAIETQNTIAQTRCKVQKLQTSIAFLTNKYLT
jgi:hypothetical protein